TTVAPWAAHCSARARPRPAAAPVISTPCPATDPPAGCSRRAASIASWLEIPPRTPAAGSAPGDPEVVDGRQVNASLEQREAGGFHFRQQGQIQLGQGDPAALAPPICRWQALQGAGEEIPDPGRLLSEQRADDR